MWLNFHFQPHSDTYNAEYLVSVKLESVGLCMGGCVCVCVCGLMLGVGKCNMR